MAQVYVLLGVFAEAEEVTQEAFVRAYRHWSVVRDYDVPGAWVRRVAFNLAVNSAKRTRRAAAALARLDLDRAVPPASVEDVALVAALRALPLHYRQVLVLHHLVELTVEEVAADLQVPAGTVKTRLARGRRRLAELLNEDMVADRGRGGAEVVQP